MATEEAVVGLQVVEGPQQRRPHDCHLHCSQSNYLMEAGVTVEPGVPVTDVAARGADYTSCSDSSAGHSQTHVGDRQAPRSEQSRGGKGWAEGDCCTCESLGMDFVVAVVAAAAVVVVVVVVVSAEETSELHFHGCFPDFCCGCKINKCYIVTKTDTKLHLIISMYTYFITAEWNINVINNMY